MTSLFFFYVVNLKFEPWTLQKNGTSTTSSPNAGQHGMHTPMTKGTGSTTRTGKIGGNRGSSMKLFVQNCFSWSIYIVDLSIEPSLHGSWECVLLGQSTWPTPMGIGFDERNKSSKAERKTTQCSDFKSKIWWKRPGMHCIDLWGWLVEFCGRQRWEWGKAIGGAFGWGGKSFSEVDPSYGTGIFWLDHLSSIDLIDTFLSTISHMVNPTWKS